MSLVINCSKSALKYLLLVDCLGFISLNRHYQRFALTEVIFFMNY